MDAHAEYFVLRLDDGGKDPSHVQASRKAVLAYADGIQATIPKLAEDIRARWGEMAKPGWPKVTPKNSPANKKQNRIMEKGGKATVDDKHRGGERTEV